MRQRAELEKRLGLPGGGLGDEGLGVELRALLRGDAVPVVMPIGNNGQDKCFI